MTVPKRRQPRPVTEAQAIADIATWLAHVWPAVEATYAALAAPTTRAGGAGNRGTDVPDPTHTVVASLEHHDETREGLTGALAQLRWVQGRARAVLREHPDVARDAQATIAAMRCSGEVDPTCTRNAVKTGLCDPCYTKKRRQVRAAEQERQAS